MKINKLLIYLIIIYLYLVTFRLITLEDRMNDNYNIIQREITNINKKVQYSGG